MDNKQVRALMIWLYRLTRGMGTSDWQLLLSAQGRKTGRRRTVPLRYVRDGDAYVVIASNWGKPQMPAWYLNLQAHPDVEVQVGGRVFQAQARTARLDERQRLWEMLVRSYRGYEGYAEKTTRVLPIVRLTPR